jgi:hypothetical protein
MLETRCNNERMRLYRQNRLDMNRTGIAGGQFS